MDEFKFIEDIRFKILAKEETKLAEKFIEEGEACPYCRSDDIEEYEADWNAEGVRTIPMQCNECGKTWQGIFILQGIRTEELDKAGRDLIPETE